MDTKLIHDDIARAQETLDILHLHAINVNGRPLCNAGLTCTTTDRAGKVTCPTCQAWQFSRWEEISRWSKKDKAILRKILAEDAEHYDD